MRVSELLHRRPQRHGGPIGRRNVAPVERFHESSRGPVLHIPQRQEEGARSRMQESANEPNLFVAARNHAKSGSTAAQNGQAYG